MAKVLIIDDDACICRVLEEVVRRAGHQPSTAHTCEEGLALARSDHQDIILLDICLPDRSGLEALPELRTGVCPPEVIVMTGFCDPDGADLAIRHGAWDYVCKDSLGKRITLSLIRALQYRESRNNATTPDPFDAQRIVGNAPRLKVALATASQASKSDAAVLITGQTGTGKELVATAIHENSARSKGPFVVVDCAALPNSLVGSVLFGHERGAFTGAERSHHGLIYQAHGGTLFLDEVGEMPLDVQKNFLRALQERRFQRIGSNTSEESDFRLISATNRDLDQLVEQGVFRHDLLFRLRSLTVMLPPLRECREDIPLLARHFVSRQCELLCRGPLDMSDGFLESLLAYDWPGNVREIKLAIEGAVTKAGQADTLYPNHLPYHVRSRLLRAELRRIK